MPEIEKKKSWRIIIDEKRSLRIIIIRQMKDIS